MNENSGHPLVLVFFHTSYYQFVSTAMKEAYFRWGAGSINRGCHLGRTCWLSSDMKKAMSGASVRLRRRSFPEDLYKEDSSEEQYNEPSVSVCEALVKDNVTCIHNNFSSSVGSRQDPVSP